MKLYFKTGKSRFYQGDCLDVIRSLSDESVDCGVTSPPYWGLRDYATEGQLGLEASFEEYIEKLIKIFREFRRVLKNSGTLWLNLGDSYNSGAPGAKNPARWPKQSRNNHTAGKKIAGSVKYKDMFGIPWRVALALQDDGWWLRQDIIWHKPNVMPESVKDRCTKAHEYIFLLSKSADYYFDYKTIQEPCSGKTNARISKAEIKRITEARTTRANTSAGANRKSLKIHRKNGLVKQNQSFENAVCLPVKKRNKRSVWTVPTQAFKGAHFATFPPDLILPCVLAGCPEGGTVMDMFFGTGTTGLAAVENNRSFIGAEISEKYCEIAVRRIEPVSSQLTFRDFLTSF